MNATLADLQKNFRAYVLDGDAAPIIGAVQESAEAGAAERLNVYSQAYRLRLLEVLSNDLPGLRALAGEDRYEQLCYAYIEATPSSHFNIRWYGTGMAQFLRSTSPWSADAALAEMAALEWDMTLVFDAIDEPIVETQFLAALDPQDWAGMQLRLSAALRRLRLDWNVAEIRRAIDREEELPTLQRAETTRDWVVWRKDRGVRHRALEVDEAAALDAVDRGASFADLCELLCEWHSEDAVAMRAASLLARWVQEQWISEIVLAPNDD